MSENHPFISVIIPTYARNGQVTKGLHAFTQQQYPRDRFEIIIVNDGSPEPLAPLCQPFCDQLDIKLVQQANAGPAVARNTGAAQARGEIFAFTDDDCRPDPYWLSDLADCCRQFPHHAIGGHTINVLADNPYATASQLLVQYLYQHYNANRPGARFFTTNNLAVPAHQFWQMGGFHLRMPLAAGEDREFCDRWLHHGFEMHYADRAIINHAHPLTFVSYWQQHLRYGRGACHFHLIRSQRYTGSIQLEPLSFYVRLLLYPWQKKRGRKALTLAVLLTISQAANALGFIWQRLRTNPNQLELPENHFGDSGDLAHRL